MLVDWIADPVNSWVVPDGVVSSVNHDNLIELVGTVLAHPVAVQDSQSSNLPANTFLGN